MRRCPRRTIATLGLLPALALVGCGATGGASTAAATVRPRGWPSDDPPRLAAELDRAQHTIDSESAPAATLREAAHLQQFAFAQLTGRRAIRRRTLALLSPAARAAARAAIRAAAALAAIVPAEHRFPPWRIVGPPPPGRLLGYFRTAAGTYRIPWQYLAAIELVETRMGRIRGRSPAGAQGPMQFMPATWAEYGQGSIRSQRASIMAAARFLVANGGRNAIGRALFHYNPSSAYVAAVESYAREMRSDPRAFYGYYEWQVLYRTAKGTFLLPSGYPGNRPVRLPSWGNH